jgi:PAS domain S-box-containing protein
LGLTAKLTIAFCTVVLVMVLGNTGYSLFLALQESREAAQNKVELATKAIHSDIVEIQRQNGQLAQQLARDPNFLTPYTARNKADLAAFLKGVIATRGLVGVITVTDSQGKVFYSSDTPAKSGEPVRSKSKLIERAYTTMGPLSGYASFNPNYVTMSCVAPIIAKNQVDGAVIVSQPLNSEFLVGEVRKLEMLPNYVNGIDLVLIRASDNRLKEVTSDLANENNRFVAELSASGLRALPVGSGQNWFNQLLHLRNGFEKDGRWWSTQYLHVGSGNEAEEVGAILISAPVPNPSHRMLGNITLYGTTAGIAVFLSLLFAAGIAKSITAPLKILKKRASDLAVQKTNLPPLSGLRGDWAEVGEKLETAVASMRSSVQSLKNQVTKLSEESVEKNEQSDSTSTHLESLNRQITSQSKQLAEVQKQISNSNRQAILLQHKLNAVLQSSTEGFLVLDQFGNVLSANPIFLGWLGCTEAEIAGRMCFDLVRKPGESRASEAQSRVFVKHTGDPHQLVNEFYPEGVVYHRSQSKAVEVLAHLQPVASDDSSIQGYVMVLRDKSLRREISQLRSEIVSMLSESLRAPIVAAESSWTTILRNAPDTMHPAVGQSLTELHHEYEHLIGIIDSLLMVYGGVMPTPIQHRETFAIQRLIAECQEEHHPLVRERRVTLDYKGVASLPEVTADRGALKAVLSQLMEKMINITASGGKVRVEVHVKGQEMRIRVASSGPALPDSEIADMFIGFIPGKHREETYSDRLSMYLASNNVERLGGKVWAESQDGKGTAIFFTLPVK